MEETFFKKGGGQQPKFLFLSRVLKSHQDQWIPQGWGFQDERKDGGMQNIDNIKKGGVVDRILFHLF